MDYNEGTNIPTNNLGNASTKISPQKIPAGTTVSESATASVTTYRSTFYIALPFDNKMTDEQIKALTSADIREMTGIVKKNGDPTSWSVTGKAQFIIFTQSGKNITEAKTQDNLPFTFTKVQNNGSDYTVSIEGAEGSAGVNYKVWVDTEGSDVTNTINIKWANQ